jgi:quercetin dioxygenase-like cupin family protein
MKLLIKLLFVTGIMAAGCNQLAKPNKYKQHQPQLDAIFPKGEKITNSNFVGTAWLNMLVNADTVMNTQIGNVSFEPKARTNWHYHTAGQILLVTGGLGYYQEKGKLIQLMRKGDVIICQPNIVHWHGASPDSSLTHIAISANTNKVGAVWLEPVTEDEYAQRPANF